MPGNQKVVIICGPTASGKSALALRLAETLPVEIINADSQQVYCGLDLGTAKPSADDLRQVPHHLIDSVPPDASFSAADFVAAADEAITTITARGSLPVVVGGTGLYLRALLHGLVDSPSGAATIRQELQAEADEKGAASLYMDLQQVDPLTAARIHPHNLVRIIRALEVYRLTGIPLSTYQQQHGFNEVRYDCLQLGIQVGRQELYQRIDSRVERMLNEGLLQEVQQLLASGLSPSAKGLGAIGYKEMLAYLAGEYDLDEAVRLIKRNTRHYAKRQMTWFQADRDIVWFDYPEKYVTIRNRVIDFFECKERNHGKSTV